MASSVPKKRKVTEEARVFQNKWTEDYFFIETQQKAICLICQESVAVMKAYNLKRHYDSKHSSKFDTIKGQFRADKIETLKKNIQFQQMNLSYAKPSADNAAAQKVSFVIAKKIAEKSKPFTDGEFIKECLTSAAEILCPAQKSKFDKVSLSASTITRRIEDLAENLEHALKNLALNFVYYSIAVDESTDMTDTAQLAIFIRGIDENFTTHEELAALYPMKETTRGEDVFLSLKEVLQKYGLKFNNLAGIATDGAPSMIGKNEGLVALIRKHFDFSDTPLMQYHCIIHQVHLCAKKVNFEGVMNVVVKTVNFIKSKGLNHRDFQTFLEQMESEYGDVLYYSEVRWLSRGKMLDRVFQLKDEIKVFMSLKGKDVLEFSDPDWLCDFGFLVDITKHLNNLNLQLQGKNNFIHDLFGKIRAFEMKLKLFKSQLKDQNFAHFPALKTCDPVSTERYVVTIADLETHFDSRFSDFKKNELDMKLFYSPFNVSAEDVNETIQMELIDFQSNPSLKEKFTNTGLIEFYSKYLKQSEFPNIYTNALRMASLFGSTYICEQFFTQMKIVKSKTRTKITDRHLENTLRIATTKMDTDIDNLVNQMQNHLSH